jgi:hypothetical protein
MDTRANLTYLKSGPCDSSGNIRVSLDSNDQLRFSLVFGGNPFVHWPQHHRIGVRINPAFNRKHQVAQEIDTHDPPRYGVILGEQFCVFVEF